jgi:hypothetical protein
MLGGQATKEMAKHLINPENWTAKDFETLNEKCTLKSNKNEPKPKPFEDEKEKFVNIIILT